MTVSYTGQVATCRGFGCFLKLLFRWRGSIYKLVWLDLVCFLSLYYFLNIMYRFVLDPYQKKIFEAISIYCTKYSNLIPLSFVLGFYVSIVMARWWNQYTSIPWPDSMAVYVSANVHGQDERGRLMRRTIMRYVCLCLTMVLTNVSPRVKKRFPTMDHLVEAGLLVENEKQVMEQFNSKFNSYSKHWMPIVWAATIVTRARKEGRIRDDLAVKTIIDELNKFRGQAGLLISYDTISVPLVYTQVVTLAVYSFFITSIMGQQWLENKPIDGDVINMIDMYFPIFTTLQFFFYMGWLKVAESLINPFGEDDDDFEVNWMIDRNLQVVYMIVDEMHHNHPELVRDQYWDEVFPVELPYTEEMKPFREKHPAPSTTNINIPKSSMTSVKLDEMVGKSVQSVNYKFPETDVEAGGGEDTASGIHFTAGHSGRPSSLLRKGSSASISSQMGSLNRVNTVVSSLKRFFSREDPRPSGNSGGTPLTPDVTQQTRLPGSASATSLSAPKFPSMRITDQVIEEVDEQMTIQSMRPPDQRPTAQSIFQQESVQPPQSDPVDVPAPNSNNHHHQQLHYRPTDFTRTQSYAPQPFTFPTNSDPDFISSSAPATGGSLSGTTAHRVITPSGDQYDISIEDFDSTRPNSQSSIINMPPELNEMPINRGGGDAIDIGSGSPGLSLSIGLGGSNESNVNNNNKKTTDERFFKMRQARERDRQTRITLARSISAQQQQQHQQQQQQQHQQATSPDTDLLLNPIINAGQTEEILNNNNSSSSSPTITVSTSKL